MQGGPLGPNFFLLGTALNDPCYGMFSRSPARGIFEHLFGDPRERRGDVALPPTSGPRLFSSPSVGDPLEHRGDRQCCHDTPLLPIVHD